MVAKRSFIFCLILFPVLLLAQSETGFAPSKGVNIYYELYGSGEPMVIINGGPGFNSKGFQALATSLSKKYHVILYDQRGTGASEMEELSTGNMTMDLMVADLEALRKHLEYDEWTVLGHSFGGMLGNYYLSKHPSAVKAFIASASGGVDLGLLDNFDITRRLTDTQRDSFIYWTDRLQSGDTTQLAQRQRRAYMAYAYVYNDTYAPQVAKRLGQSNMYINQLIWQDLQRIKYDIKEAAKNFQNPVLIIQGEQDVIVPELGEKAHQAFPNSTLVLMPECGHYGWLDQPSLYFEAIEAFMRQVTTADNY